MYSYSQKVQDTIKAIAEQELVPLVAAEDKSKFTGNGGQVKSSDRNPEYFTTGATTLPGFEIEHDGKKYRVQPQFTVNIYHADGSSASVVLTKQEQRQINTGTASPETLDKLKRLTAKVNAL
jgi:hypothetical protein